MTRKSLDEYLALAYPFSVLAEPDGGYVVTFPDLPGCMTQVEDPGEVGPTADEIRTLWIESAYANGLEIPPPSYPGEYSGKFNLRLPGSLHRELATAAEREGVSLNQYVATLLARRDAQAQVERRLARIEAQLAEMHEGLPYRFRRTAAPGRSRGQLRLVTPEEAIAV